MPLTKVTQNVIEGIVSTGSTGVSAGSFIVGQQYKITALGTTTQAQWNTIAGTTGQTYVVGSLFTAATTGASSGNGAAAVARTLANRFADVVNVKDFGAVGDGATDDFVAIQAAFNFANQKAIYFPSGIYLSSGLITSSDKSISIFGAGVPTTRIVFTTSNGGFDFLLDNQGPSLPPDKFAIKDITISCTVVVSNPALKIKWKNYQPNADGQLWIENINILSNNTGSAGFTKDIVIENCIVGLIERCILQGAWASRNTDPLLSIEAISLVDCVGIRISDTDINGYKSGIVITKNTAIQTEGIFVNGCFIYDVWKGIYVDTAIHINIINTHININGSSAEYCVFLKDCNQSYIGDGSLLYIGGLVTDPANQDCIKILNGGTHIITSCQIVCVRPANSRYGIVVVNSNYNLISDNLLISCPESIFISTGDYNSIINNSLVTASASTISNTSATSYIVNNKNNNTALGSVRWGEDFGSSLQGEIHSDANWGGKFRGYAGAIGDLAFADSTNTAAIVLKGNAFFPQTDNIFSVGTAGNRYTTIYATTGTINTSDEREKQQIRELFDKEKIVAQKLKLLVKAFKFNDAVEKKGDEARIHFGLIAQDVFDTFNSEGIDAQKYGIFCLDELKEQKEIKDKNGDIVQEYRPAGNRYGIRYEELLAFIISAI